MQHDGKRTWRTHRYAVPPFTRGRGVDYSRLETIPATRFFDQLSFIGDEWVGCFVLETSEGVVLIDTMEPRQRYFDMIETGLAELGYEGSDIAAVLITHGHFDHYGNAGALREKYGCKLYMTAGDEAFARDPETPRPPFLDGPMPFAVDGHLEDGVDFVLGDTAIAVFETPGHTPHCASFIIKVSDEGRAHAAALWGGTGIPRSARAREQYLESCGRFRAACVDRHVDVEISTHPFIDCTKQRLEICRRLCDGVANPFVIGEKAALRYQDMFRQMCVDEIAKAVQR